MSRAMGYFETGPTMRRVGGRGRALATLKLLQAAYDFLVVAAPTTVRGVCYKLFTQGVIPDMSKASTSKVSRILTDARERGECPWDWLVDEGRSLERRPSWRDATDYLATVRRAYRRDFWEHQPVRCEIWSEKGTVRGVVQPVLDHYGVGFRVFHGFTSATSVMDVCAAAAGDGVPLVAYYVGDYDPSGLCMSERDLPDRLERYGGSEIHLERIALLEEDTASLPSFPATDKRGDTRYAWFVQHFGARCWELDAMHPNDLRDRVESKITEIIEPEAWARCERAQEAEQESLESYMARWTPPEVAA